jgi:uncharacterized protein YutE (UPF0331/DUF86 family)
VISRPVDPERIAEHAGAAERCLDRLERLSGLPPERFEDRTDFDTAIVARAALREGLESILSIGRHVLARRHRVAISEYRQVAVELNRVGVVPSDLREDFVSLAGLRNRLTHAYLAVGPAELHRVVSRQLPVLRRILAALVVAAGLPGAVPSGSGPSEVREPRVRYRKTSAKPAPSRSVRKRTT